MNDSLFNETVDAASGNVTFAPVAPIEEPKKRKRNGRDENSEDAKRKVDLIIDELYLQVLESAFNLHTFTHAELTESVNTYRRHRGMMELQGATVRTRCDELRKEGFIRRTEEKRRVRRKDGSLRPSAWVWELTALGQHRLDQTRVRRAA